MSILKEIITKKVIELRTKLPHADPCKPRFVESDQYKLGSKVYTRLRIILRSNGCSIPTCTMCPFPNEAVNSDNVLINAKQYIEQVKTTLVQHHHHDILSIYNDGSFFAESELPQQTRQEIYRLAKNNKCRYLMVESLPCFITQQCLEEAKEILGENVTLIVGIGLQSASDEIREICVGTAIKKSDFLQANELLKKFGYDTKCYIIFKPPFLLEEEAITDAVESTIWLYEHNIKDITLCPTRVAKQTILQQLFDMNLYAIPKLTSFAKCLSQLQQLNIQVRVSVFNIQSSDFDALTPSGCSICEERIKKGLALYNDMQKVNFEELLCEACAKQADKNDPAAFKELNYQERIKMWLDLSEKTT